MLRIDFSGMRKAMFVGAGVGVLALLVMAAASSNVASAFPPPDKDKAPNSVVDKGTGPAHGGKPADGKARAGKVQEKAKRGPSGKAGINHAKRGKITPKTSQLDWDWPSIAFGNGVTVGGSAHLTLQQDGSYSFRGHFHDAGILGYDTCLVYVVKDSQNRAYTFVHKGGVAGLFGNHDDDWNDTGKNPEIAKNWASISQGTALGRASANFDIAGFFKEIQQAVGVVVQVVEIVGEILLTIG